MDNFREWVSDNLRYIMLIIIVAVVVIAAFFAVRFLNNRNTGESQETAAAEQEQQETEQLTPAEDQSAPAAEAIDPLRENEPAEIADLVKDYYQALTDQDIAAMTGLVDFLSDEDAANIVTDEKTRFSNIDVYVKNGLNTDSYVAYASYKYSNSEFTDVPGLSQLYIIKNDEGKYVVKSGELTSEENTLLTQLNSDPEVKALIEKVQNEYQASDAAAAAENAEESSEEAPAEEASPEEAPAADAPAEEAAAENTQQEAQPAENEQNAAPAERSSSIVSDCYVRKSASYDGEVLGVITGGTEITVYGEAENGWYHINGGGFDGYVGHSFVK